MARYGFWAFLLVAVAAFVARGPTRALLFGHQSADLAAPYAATAAFVEGRNPYEHAVLEDVLASRGRERGPDGKAIVTTSLYPPSTFALLAPLTLLDWPGARLLFLLLNLSLIAWHIPALLRFARLRLSDNAGMFLMGAILALAPYQSAVALGQVAVASVTLLVVALDRIERGHERSGAVALALAVLLKPQLAAPFGVYYLLTRRWRVVSVASVVGACVAAIALGWLAAHDIAWIESWRGNISHEMRADIDPRGARGYHMVDARIALSSIGVYPAEGAALALGGVIAAVLLWLGGRRQLDRDVVLAAIGVLTLLVTYHRHYDAMLLCLTLAWAAGEYSRSRSRVSLGALLCCAAFLLPAQVIAGRLVSERQLGPALEAVLSNSFVLSHQAWTLLLLTALLIFRLSRSRQDVSTASNPSHS